MAERHVLFYFPQNPYPPATGAHQRCLEMIRGLREHGCKITFLSADHSSETKWSAASAEYLRSIGVGKIHVYKQSPALTRIKSVMAKIYWLINKMTGASPQIAIDSGWFTPQPMRSWFERIARTESPDVFMMSYAYFDGLLENIGDLQVLRIMDMHDVASLNLAMRRVLEPLLPARVGDKFDEALLQEDYFVGRGVAADPKEFALYNRYDYTIAISADEAAMVAAQSPRTTAVFIPMTQPIFEIDNTYEGPPVFAASDAPLNVQGYWYFAKRVLPIILEQEPSFVLRVAGTIAKRLPSAPAPGVELVGFVPNIADIYRTASFAICPVLGRTGQQIKIFEAMAHGLPVIATQATAGGSPIEHERNGFVASDAEAFAASVVRLWRERNLCKMFGESARHTIQTNYSSERLRESLATILP